MQIRGEQICQTKMSKWFGYFRGRGSQLPEEEVFERKAHFEIRAQ